jgi:hypothetical protein
MQGAEEMTTSQTDDDQLVQAHDQAISEDNPTEPEAGVAAPEPDLAEDPDAEREAHEDFMAHPVGPAALTDIEPAVSVVPDYPGFTADGDDAAAEPGMTGGSPSLVSGAFTVPESVADSHPASDTASAAGPWNAVQAMFVDNPRASIERASGLVDDRVEDLIRSVRERQRSIQSAWQADAAGTEELRVALQHYRSFWTSLEDLPA